MGLCLDSTPAMGEYSVEVRRESFYLRGADSYDNDDEPHAIIVYPVKPGAQTGTVEILTADIPKIRAALELVEKHARNP